MRIKGVREAKQASLDKDKVVDLLAQAENIESNRVRWICYE